MEKRIENLGKTTASLVEHIQTVHLNMFNVFENISSHLNKIEGEIGIMNKKIEAIDTKINALSGYSATSFVKVDIKLDDLKTEIQRINDVTGYQDLFRNMKDLPKA